MKIGIITLPFNWNYGGILQNFALQWTLLYLGHKPVTINRMDKISFTLKDKITLYAKRTVLKYICQKDISIRCWPNKHELDVIKQNTDRFITENIALTEPLHSEKELDNAEKYKCDAFIVGSDQIWRPKYSPNIENHFLGFLKSDSREKRISYAASFGTDEWEYNTKQTQQCAKLAKQFDAISVREDSAVDLCRNNLGVKAQILLDPTLLVPKEEYIKLVEKDGITKMPGTLFNYVLDLTEEKKTFIESVGAKLKLVPFSSTAKKSFFKTGKKGLYDCVFPPVTHWLRAFMDAEFIITDSFHGTAFSIIFNKPFIAIGNSKRGLSRFRSVLKIFEIENRLITENDLQSVDGLINNTINYDAVNKILEEQKIKSIEFLRKSSV